MPRRICRPRNCTDITTGEIGTVDFQAIYDCQIRRYVRVGANACDQFHRLSGCSGEELWYTCGDVRPDAFCANPGRGMDALICVKNPPQPGLICETIGRFTKFPENCD